jgi:hypothetical protein
LGLLSLECLAPESESSGRVSLLESSRAELDEYQGHRSRQAAGWWIHHDTLTVIRAMGWDMDLLPANPQLDATEMPLAYLA